MPGPGLSQTVDQILRTPSRIGLLAAIEATGGAVVAVDEHWLNGIKYASGEGCGVGYQHAYPFGCGVRADPEDEDSAPQETPDKTAMNFETDETSRIPFAAIVGRTCSTLGWGEENFAAKVTRVFEACESAIVENEVWTGAAQRAGNEIYGQALPDPAGWLANEDGATVQTSEALTATNALAALEDGLAQCCGEGGFIHIPYSTAELFQERGLLVADGRILRTILGNVVVPGKGYPGTAPNGDESASGEAWIYATGPMRYWRTRKIDVLPGTFGEALVRDDDGLTNSLQFFAERGYLLDFDPCCWFAAQMSLEAQI